MKLLMKGEEVKKVREMHEYGDCSFCGGKVKSDKVELVYQYRGKLYIFQNVPAGVCPQCGEKYLTAKVAKEIEQRIQTKEKEKWDKTISVQVDVLPEEIGCENNINMIKTITIRKQYYETIISFISWIALGFIETSTP